MSDSVKVLMLLETCQISEAKASILLTGLTMLQDFSLCILLY